MADREDQPPAPPEGLSADEADRLSEKFRPSWEVPEEAGNSQLSATTPAEPRKAAKQTLVGGVSPVQRQPALADSPDARKAGPSRPPAQTLVGIAPASAPPPLPKAPTSAPVTAGGSPGGPTGIAKLYKPKDDPSAPAVMLTEEVQQAEAATNAELEARRRAESSRRMQTVLNVKAPDLPGPPPRPKRRSGVWQLLIGAGAGLVVVAAVFKLTTMDSGDGSALDSANAGPTATVEPVAAASAPPAVGTAAAAEAGPVVTPVPSEGPASPIVLPAETAGSDSVDRASQPGETVSRRSPSKPAAAAPAPKKAAPKPSKPSAKETASPPPAGKGGVIVRDSPF